MLRNANTARGTTSTLSVPNYKTVGKRERGKSRFGAQRARNAPSRINCRNVFTAAPCFGLKHHAKPLPQVTARVDDETRKVALDTTASANFVIGRIARPHHGGPTTVQLASKGVPTTS